jgi:GNAT superfamily N-acetyltransferase
MQYTIHPITDFKAIEYASSLSWPALEQLEKGDWMLRFAKGYTKRANSVNVISTTIDNITQGIIECEQAYNSRNLPCIFRLLSFNDNSRVEAALEERGYYLMDHSLVLVQDLRDKEFYPSQLYFLKCEEWLRIYCRLNEKEFSNHATHMEMLNKISQKTMFAVLRKNLKDMSCALGVLYNGYFGLFDMVTHPGYRNRGYGAELITGMLSWAKQHYAATAYLQVVSENIPAVQLYGKLGYKPGYEYHYRVQNI